MKLKFRAWLKQPKKMVKITAIDLVENKFAFDKKDGFTEWLPIHCESTIIMQSTGGKDKNGKEIFEGDIMKFFDSDRDMEGDVDIVPIIGIVQYDGATMCYYFTNRLEADMCDILDGEYPVEVLGNIYENPELLEEAK